MRIIGIILFVLVERCVGSTGPSNALNLDLRDPTFVERKFPEPREFKRLIYRINFYTTSMECPSYSGTGVLIQPNIILTSATPNNINSEIDDLTIYVKEARTRDEETTQPITVRLHVNRKMKQFTTSKVLPFILIRIIDRSKRFKGNVGINKNLLFPEPESEGSDCDVGRQVPGEDRRFFLQYMSGLDDDGGERKVIIENVRVASSNSRCSNIPMIEGVEQICVKLPRKVSADNGIIGSVLATKHSQVCAGVTGAAKDDRVKSLYVRVTLLKTVKSQLVSFIDEGIDTKQGVPLLSDEQLDEMGFGTLDPRYHTPNVARNSSSTVRPEETESPLQEGPHQEGPLQEGSQIGSASSAEDTMRDTERALYGMKNLRLGESVVQEDAPRESIKTVTTDRSSISDKTVTHTHLKVNNIPEDDARSWISELAREPLPEETVSSREGHGEGDPESTRPKLRHVLRRFFASENGQSEDPDDQAEGDPSRSSIDQDRTSVSNFWNEIATDRDSDATERDVREGTEEGNERLSVRTMPDHSNDDGHHSAIDYRSIQGLHAPTVVSSDEDDPHHGRFDRRSGAATPMTTAYDDEREAASDSDAFVYVEGWVPADDDSNDIVAETRTAEIVAPSTVGTVSQQSSGRLRRGTRAATPKLNILGILGTIIGSVAFLACRRP